MFFANVSTSQCRLVPVTKEGGYIMQPKDAIKFVDENTIGVFVILGSTYTGGFENVQEMSDLCQSILLLVDLNLSVACSRTL